MGAQCIRDSALSLQWLGSLLWHRFDPWPGKFPYAADVAEKKKNMKMNEDLQILIAQESKITQDWNLLNPKRRLQAIRSQI